jgi:hypothetical protein
LADYQAKLAESKVSNSSALWKSATLNPTVSIALQTIVYATKVAYLFLEERSILREARDSKLHA